MPALPKNYQVLVRRDPSKGWRLVRYLGARRFNKPVATKIVAKLTKRGKVAKIREIKSQRFENNQLIEKWLRGDLDFDHAMMVNLAKAARDSKTVLYVNFGKRTRAEQQVLWDKYGPPRAARPGTSRHETGKAADVVTNRTKRNVGDVKRVRAALKKHKLCLPVPREPWHVESGNVWNA